MYINTDIVASTRGAVTDVSALRMEVEINGCWLEARRADKVSSRLLHLRSKDELGDCYRSITVLLKEVETSSRLLRDLYDLFVIYQTMIPYIYHYLTVILPSLSKSMRDMLSYIDNDELPTRERWTLMEERLGDAETELANRFRMYCDAINQVIRLLSRSPLFDPTTLQNLRNLLMLLRRHQNIPGTNTKTFPLYSTKEMGVLRGKELETAESVEQTLIPVEPRTQIFPYLPPSQLSPAELEAKKRHWAEKVFDDLPHSTTSLRHRRKPFDKNLLSVTLYLHAQGAGMTRLLCRWMDPYLNPLYSSYGVHELCIRRKGAALQFRRWSEHREHSRVWAALFFKSWERMVLFHSAFLALKARCPLTVRINPDEYKLSGEIVLFQGKIIDDGFEHSLAVIQDDKTGSLRLHAAVWDGELRRCPVWTAFITYQCQSPQWMERRTPYRIILKDIKLYVFCGNYKKKNQMRRNGGFEINFVERRGTILFFPPDSPDSPDSLTAAARKFVDCLRFDDGPGSGADNGDPGPSGARAGPAGGAGGGGGGGGNIPG
ncbi:hypothetical protein HYFRA_00009828 [Hymenoscyphus fraxineus]|uniref:Uncharacterized protein n=1 Tax=Hymenoscyphus fraxineus TaxID=746836 RepID=A0A9N9L5L3_9HELO|nr:hypothetical protein HYFRA_00009828 [Hymenoscyphus fraxineus]